MHDGIKSIHWGKNHEDVALKIFEKENSRSVQKCGVFLHKSGLLGASPDGILSNTEIIEIKCPYKWRNSSLDEMVSDKSFYIESSHGIYGLKKNTNYWHQVQGQLYISKKEICYFVVFVPGKILTVVVNKDLQWSKNLSSLIAFAKNQFYPNLFLNKNANIVLED